MEDVVSYPVLIPLVLEGENVLSNKKAGSVGFCFLMLASFRNQEENSAFFRLWF